ncbi:hypothetical protein GCM10009096_23320 [Parasphingorhabdus litoris]|uniref:DUF1521 domain-containing protein n=1 Tax=Parasphingorhabdus litoris TaxID=394733 RepID=A0ABP3KIE4_9SPHN|nr:DUF1521 domain-containing protein [Parasphingorhabdus litoris]
MNAINTIAGTGLAPINLSGADNLPAGTAMQINADPLPLSPVGQAVIPVVVDVALTDGVKDLAWRQEQLQTGHVIIDIDDQYLLSIDEYQGEVLIDNRMTGEATRIWGNAQVNSDGMENLQFWGTTTFVLDNQTKVTAETVISELNPNAYILDRLVIVKSTRAIIVSGAGVETKGDMTVSLRSDAVSVDLDTPDNFILKENSDGAGWIAQNTGEIATQEDLDLTAPGELFGMQQSLASLSELSILFCRFLSMANISLLTRTLYNPIETPVNDDCDRQGAMRQITNADIAAHLRSGSVTGSY